MDHFQVLLQVFKRYLNFGERENPYRRHCTLAYMDRWTDDWTDMPKCGPKYETGQAFIYFMRGVFSVRGERVLRSIRPIVNANLRVTTYNVCFIFAARRMLTIVIIHTGKRTDVQTDMILKMLDIVGLLMLRFRRCKSSDKMNTSLILR